MKILVVDDVGYTRHYHTRLLQKHGHAAASAGGGAEALKVLNAEHDFDVVLTDLMMGDMDGIELYQQVQQMQLVDDSGLIAPPVFVLMTALHPGKNAQPRDVERIRLAREIGFFDVLFKPIEHDDLMQVLERIVRERAEGAKIETRPVLNQLQELASRLEAAGQAADIEAFLDAVEPMLSKLRDAALEAAVAGT